MNKHSKTYKQVCDAANRDRLEQTEPDQAEIEVDRREDHELWVNAGRPLR